MTSRAMALLRMGRFLSFRGCAAFPRRLLRTHDLSGAPDASVYGAQFPSGSASAKKTEQQADLPPFGPGEAGKAARKLLRKIGNPPVVYPAMQVLMARTSAGAEELTAADAALMLSVTARLAHKVAVARDPDFLALLLRTFTSTTRLRDATCIDCSRALWALAHLPPRRPRSTLHDRLISSSVRSITHQLTTASFPDGTSDDTAAMTYASVVVSMATLRDFADPTTIATGVTPCLRYFADEAGRAEGLQLHEAGRALWACATLADVPMSENVVVRAAPALTHRFLREVCNPEAHSQPSSLASGLLGVAALQPVLRSDLVTQVVPAVLKRFMARRTREDLQWGMSRPKAADFADVLWAVSHVHHLFAEAEVGNLVRDMNSLFRRFTKQPVLWTATPREIADAAFAVLSVASTNTTRFRRTMHLVKISMPQLSDRFEASIDSAGTSHMVTFARAQSLCGVFNQRLMRSMSWRFVESDTATRNLSASDISHLFHAYADLRIGDPALRHTLQDALHRLRWTGAVVEANVAAALLYAHAAEGDYGEETFGALVEDLRGGHALSSIAMAQLHFVRLFLEQEAAVSASEMIASLDADMWAACGLAAGTLGLGLSHIHLPLGRSVYYLLQEMVAQGSLPRLPADEGRQLGEFSARADSPARVQWLPVLEESRHQVMLLVDGIVAVDVLRPIRDVCLSDQPTAILLDGFAELRHRQVRALSPIRICTVTRGEWLRASCKMELLRGKLAQAV